MLDIWVQQDDATKEAFCALQAQESGEKFNPSCIKLYISKMCPYGDYDFARIEIEPHIMSISGHRTQVHSRCVSYALLKKAHIKGEYAVIPFRQNGNNLYQIKEILEFRVTQNNIVPYITLWGHLATNPPFYFISRLDQVDKLCISLSQADRDHVINSIRALCKVDQQGELELNSEKMSYFMLGDTFSIRLPCLYTGNLHMATIKIAVNGMPDMTDENPTQVEGLFDEEPNFNYYPLEETASLEKEVEAYRRKLHRARNVTVLTLYFDTFFNMWILPLFVFNLFVILTLGLARVQIFDYFERIKQSHLLTAAAILIGGLGTCVAIFRYAFLELVVLLKKLVPSVWSYLVVEMEAYSKNALARFGYPAFFAITILEHSLKILMHLSLLVYGGLIAFKLTMPTPNFGQSIAIILSDIPFLGRELQKYLYHTPFQVVMLPDPISQIVAWLVGFLFSTILVGFLTRLFRFTRAD